MAAENWILLRRDGRFYEIAEKFGIDPVTARVLVNRGLTENADIEKFLHGTLDDLHDPMLLKGAAQAAQRIADRIRQGSRIRIIGDYDIDGVFSTYILYDVLHSLGGCVDYDIPDRVRDGYGLNMHLIEKAAADGIEMIVTCDNGITAHKQIAAARAQGIEVILTDHHQPLWQEKDGLRSDDLPEADVIVDPHVSGETYPYPQICGAVVAWKVMQQLLRICEREREYLRYLPYAAFATIGDVMPLQDENRIIVSYGLEALAHTGNRGMETLIRSTGILEKGNSIRPYHVGYILGPCINAAGRLDTAMKSLDMLTTTNALRADELAGELADFNADRQEMTDRGEEAAHEMIEREPYVTDRVLVLYLPECSERIMGIVAGRIREWTGKPAFVLTDAEQEGMLKGSGRSIPAYHMHDALVQVSSLLEVFGGHALAAGLTIRKDHLAPFRKALLDNCTLTEEDLVSRVDIDVAMPVSYLLQHTNVIEDLHRLEPCGQGNRSPLFAQASLRTEEIRVMGRRANVIRFQFITPEGIRIPGILFGKSELILGQLGEMFDDQVVNETMHGRYCGMDLDVLYVPEYNEYRGQKTLQLAVKHFRKAHMKQG